MNRKIYPKRGLFIFVLANVFFISSVFSQVPAKMSYQAVIRNSSNELVQYTKIGMQISILKGSANGISVFTEIHYSKTNENGLVSIEIGGGSVVSGSFADINWANGPYFIKTETDINGGADYTITGTSQLLSVPYALHAKTAQTVTGSIIETQNLNAVLTLNNSAGNKSITNLANPVNAQDAATKAYVDELKAQIEELKFATGLLVKDADGNVYKSVIIGKQIWMVENLRTTKYKNGLPIPLVADSAAWGTLTTPGYCWYGNNQSTYGSTYGALYNWYTVNTGNLCPTGWHVPNNDEYTTLANFLGGESVAGGKLKEVGTSHWVSPNTGATNEVGFTGLPGGYRYGNGKFGFIGSSGYWWTATPSDSLYARHVGVRSSVSSLYRLEIGKGDGFSVRCLKD